MRVQSSAAEAVTLLAARLPCPCENHSEEYAPLGAAGRTGLPVTVCWSVWACGLDTSITPPAP